MEFKAVEFMRKARDKISNDIQGMSFEEEKEYIREHNKSFAYLTDKTPNNCIKSEFKPSASLQV